MIPKMQASMFGRELKKVHVLSIPDNGSEPKLINILIRAPSEDYRLENYTKSGHLGYWSILGG
jgi:hypothetical protein